MHTCTHTHTHIHIYIYPHLHAHTNKYTYTYRHIYIHRHINTCKTICNLFQESSHPDVASRGNQSAELRLRLCVSIKKMHTGKLNKF